MIYLQNLITFVILEKRRRIRTSNVSLIDGHIDEHKLSDEQIITLVNKNAKYSSQYKMIADLINRKNAEIERLKNESIERIRKTTKMVYEKEIAEAKSEAIKEFAERLKSGIGVIVTHIRNGHTKHILELIDNLLKEMVGD